MFRDWQYLIGEIMVLLAAAGGLGLVCGWLLRSIAAWGDARKVRMAEERVHEKEDQIAIVENDYLKLKRRYNEALAEYQIRIDEAEETTGQLEKRLARIEEDHARDIEALRSSVSDRDRRILDLETLRRAEGQGETAQSDQSTTTTTTHKVVARRATPTQDRQKDLPHTRIVEESKKSGRSGQNVVSLTPGLAEEQAPLTPPPGLAEVGSRPAILSVPRNGVPDDLKKINGIGPKLELQCHMLGIFHFDQIAEMTPEELAWLDANLVGFEGRASRDRWVAQARVLAGFDTDEEEDAEDVVLRRDTKA